MKTFKKDGSLSADAVSALNIVKASLKATPRGDLEITDLRGWAFSGRGHKFKRLTDRAPGLTWILESLGVTFEEFNNAPRGGAIGYAVRIPTSNRRKIRALFKKYGI